MINYKNNSFGIFFFFGGVAADFISDFEVL